jgi:hypothetical protein
MSQGPVPAVVPESGVPLDPELPELLPELALPELLPELAALPELLPELAALPELLPELALPELLPELALPEVPPEPSLLLDPVLPPALESDSSCPPLASGTEFDGPTLEEPQEQKVAIAVGTAKSQRARIGARSLPSSKAPSVYATAGRTAAERVDDHSACLQGDVGGAGWLTKEKHSWLH